MNAIIGRVEALPDKDTILINQGTMKGVKVKDEVFVFSKVKTPFTNIEDNITELRGKAEIVFVEKYFCLAKITLRSEDLSNLAKSTTGGIASSATTAAVLAKVASVLGIVIAPTAFPALLLGAAAILAWKQAQKISSGNTAVITITSNKIVAVNEDSLVT